MRLSEQEKNRLRTLYGPWAIVTGASSGIGLALTRQLASAGMNLVIVSRQQEKLNEVAEEIKSFGKEVIICAADVSEPTDLNRLINITESLDVGLIIAAAGYGTSGLFIDQRIDEEVNMLRVNCEAVLILTHHFGRKFKARGRGGIILMSSLVAFQGVPYSANYAASKAYIQSFAEALQIELKQDRIDVLAVAPGPVNSGFGSRAKMKMGHALNPEHLSVPILKALGRKKNILPGLLSKVLIYSLRLVPRAMKVKIMSKIMHGFTAHQREVGSV